MLTKNEDLSLWLYLPLLQSYIYRARFMRTSGEHDVLRFIQLNI